MKDNWTTAVAAAAATPRGTIFQGFRIRISHSIGGHIALGYFDAYLHNCHRDEGNWRLTLVPALSPGQHTWRCRWREADSYTIIDTSGDR